MRLPLAVAQSSEIVANPPTGRHRSLSPCARCGGRTAGPPAPRFLGSAP